MRRAQHISSSILGIWLSLLVVANPATSADCIAVPNTVKFSEGSVAIVTKREPHQLSYDMTKPDGVIANSMVVHDLFTISATSPKGTARFKWTSPLPDITPFKSGQSYEGQAVIVGYDGSERPFSQTIEIGHTDTIMVSGCSYPVTQVTTLTDGSSYSIRYIHEPSMITMRTTNYTVQAGGEPKKMSEFLVVEIRN